MLKWRNNGETAFSDEKQLEVDTLKQHNLLEIYQLGQYQTRQYEIVMTDYEQSVGIATIEEQVRLQR